MDTNDSIQLANDVLRDVDKLYNLAKRLKRETMNVERMHATLLDIQTGSYKFCAFNGCMEGVYNNGQYDACPKHEGRM